MREIPLTLRRTRARIFAGVRIAEETSRRAGIDGDRADGADEDEED